MYNFLTTNIFFLFSETSEGIINYIFIEKIQVCADKNKNFIDTLMKLICFFYIFNLMYPKEICMSMEFLTRFFFKHYPSQIRGSKKSINNLSKINNLIKKINEFK